jgi:hypothetical protein
MSSGILAIMQGLVLMWERADEDEEALDEEGQDEGGGDEWRC